MDYMKHVKGKRVLMTGASGFIGRGVVEQGLKCSLDIHSISCDDIVIQGVKSYFADIVDFDSVNKIITEVKPNIVIHLAAAGVKN